MAELLQIHSTDIFIDNLNLDNTLLAKYCYDELKLSNGRQISNEGGWQSNDMMENGKFFPLVKEIEKKCISLKEHFYYTSKVKFVVTEAWININKKFNFNWKHSHIPSKWSAIYYIQTNQESGSLVLYSAENLREITFPRKLIEKYHACNCSQYSLNPLPGQLIFFPGYLEHKVMPNLSDIDRISMAFNIAFNV